jgi:hypothetical protein
MKAVINGKRYDTETADLVAQWSNHYYPNDFHYCEEALYRTKKGNWFIHGEGGAMSSYSRPCGNNGSCGGEEIRVLTPDEAREWLEGKDRVEELELYFSDEIEEA